MNDNGSRNRESSDSASDTKDRRVSGPPFFFNEALLQPDLGIPLPLIINQKQGFQAIVRDVLTRCGAVKVAIEPTTVILGSLLFGCQEFLAGCQDLVAAASPEAVGDACQRILAACREFSGHLEGAHVIVQAMEGFATDDSRGADIQPAPCSRLKHLSSHLERLFDSGPVRTGMDLGRRALVEVHLDELFDQCSRHLESFYYAILHREAPRLFADFSYDFHRGLFKRMVPEHIFDPVNDTPAGGEDRTGLLDLLPELQESVELAVAETGAEKGGTEAGRRDPDDPDHRGQ